MKEQPETSTSKTRSREEMAGEVISTGKFVHQLRRGGAENITEEIDWARIRLGVLFWALNPKLSRKEADERATQWCYDILQTNCENEFLNDLLHDAQQEMERYDGC